MEINKDPMKQTELRAAPTSELRAPLTQERAKSKDSALRIANEYLSVKDYMARYPDATEIPATLINGGKGMANIEEKDGKYTITKSNPDGKQAFQITYQKSKKYQGVLGKMAEDFTVTKSFVDTSGKAKVINVYSDMYGEKAHITEVKYPGRAILKKAKKDLFVQKEKAKGPLTKYPYEKGLPEDKRVLPEELRGETSARKYDNTAKRITSDLEEILNYTKENPQVLRMKDPYGGKGTAAVKCVKDEFGNITKIIVSKESAKAAWQDVYDLSQYNTKKLSGYVIKQHISSDPEKSRLISIYQSEPKYGHEAKIANVQATPDVYLVKDKNTGKFINVDNTPPILPPGKTLLQSIESEE